MRVLQAVLGAFSAQLISNSKSPICSDNAQVESEALSTSTPTAFQVQAPPDLPRDAKNCTVQLVQHLFTNSSFLRKSFFVFIKFIT